MAPDKSTVPAANFEFIEDLHEEYANNVFYESSTWDLKLLFGQLDQSGQLSNSEPKIKTVIHSTVTVPWTQAKLMFYWLKGHIEAHEMVNGEIHMPSSLIPPELPPLSEELKKSDPNAERVYALFDRIRKEFIESLKS